MFGDYTFGASYFGEGPGGAETANPPMQMFTGSLSLRATDDQAISIRAASIAAIQIQDVK